MLKTFALIKAVCHSWNLRLNRIYKPKFHIVSHELEKQDSTEYFVSMPSNKLELWMAMESERFQHPVFRSLYSEKNVIREERRLVVENSPTGQFIENFSKLAFEKSPYRRPVIG